MSEHQRLQHEVDNLQQRWNRLSETIALVHQQRGLEVEALARLRLQGNIEQMEAERAEVETRLQTLEAELHKLRKAELIAEARRRERNQAYLEAMGAWEEVRALDPDDPQSDQEIQRMQALQQRAQLMNERIQQLAKRMRDIKPIFAQLVLRVKQMLEGAPEDVTVLSLVDSFLANELSAAELTTMMQTLAGPNIPPPTPTMNFRALAARMKRGEIVFFLGSDIAQLFDATVLDAATVVTKLAGQANYRDFAGSLSMIAEYYHMKPEYGRSSFVQNLADLLPTALVQVRLYDLLARIEQPIVLISTAYDTLLEQAFQRVPKPPKPYVILTSLLGTDSDADVGQIVLQYSDRQMLEAPCLEQDLSHLDLLGKGYSLIYKMRGYLGPHTMQGLHQHNALLLSEENYFTFARHMDKVIPNYIVNQFAGRGLWFLGYTPAHWEDRLMTNALLAQRRQHIEPANVVRKEPDAFEETYWDRHRVRRYAFDLQEFVQQLEENFA